MDENVKNDAKQVMLVQNAAIITTGQQQGK